MGANYAFTASPAVEPAFLYTFNDSYSECQTTCLPSGSPNTIVGFYGSFRSLTCYPCPSPCSNCNIGIIRTRYPDISCGSDDFCKEGLLCTSCLLGYALVAGKCIDENSCRDYAYYVEPNVTTSWSAVDCKCLDGYSSNQYARCNLRCDITCQTCTGTGASQCSTCPTGL